MAIITGIIQDGQRSSEDEMHYMDGATITCGSAVTSSINGVFWISSTVTEATVLTIFKERSISESISMTSSEVIYRPNILLSGSVIAATVASGDIYTTTVSIFGMDLISGMYTSSTIAVTGGLNSGQICYVISNTDNSLNVKF